MHLFYADPRDIQGQSLIVRGQEAEHITKVLRHSVGDKILVTDGNGNGYECQIRDFKKTTVFLDVINMREELLSKPQVSLCLGIIKKRDRLEFAVEKAVELGVSKIILFNAEHSQKGNVREDRLVSTAISAMKQSLRFHLPEIVIEDSLEHAVSSHKNKAKVIVADETKKNVAKKTDTKNIHHFFLIIGPEGGFSKREREFLATIHPEYYSLGNKRLRAETAAIVMVDRFAGFK